jgi:DNA polymerase III alpha subunit
MISNQYGELIFSESDLCDLLMSAGSISELKNLIVDHTVNIDNLLAISDHNDVLHTWTVVEQHNQTVEEFDRTNQQQWFMPDEYQHLDIAEYILGLCNTPEQLQRAGEELLLYQERGLFDLLKYLKYLVDVMRKNRVIWGVGRGSSVASYVLYLLGVHRIDSMFYDLDPGEFLR